jgi:hypothetical protein
MAGVVLHSTDPNLEAFVPGDWYVLGPAGYETQVRQVLTRIENPDIRHALEWELQVIATGRLRDVAAHSRGPIVALFVLPATGTLEEALAAHRAEVEANAPPHTLVSEELTTDLFIPGYRTEIHSDLEGGVPTQTIEYLGILANDQVLVLNGTAPQDFPAFPLLMSLVASSLRAT